MSNLLAAWLQMAVSLRFHIIFAVAGIALPLLMAIAELLWLCTRRAGLGSQSRLTDHRHCTPVHGLSGCILHDHDDASCAIVADVDLRGPARLRVHLPELREQRGGKGTLESRVLDTQRG